MRAGGHYLELRKRKRSVLGDLSGNPTNQDLAPRSTTELRDRRAMNTKLGIASAPPIGVRIVRPKFRSSMRLEGSRSPRSLLVIVIVVIVVVDRAQEMGEDPLGHVASLLPRLHVRKAEVDALVNAGVDHILGGI